MQLEIEIDRPVHEPARPVITAHLYVVAADFVNLTRRTALAAGNISFHIARLQTDDHVTVEEMFAANRGRICRAARSS